MNKNTSTKCIHCGQLILRTISKFDSTRCQILRLKCTKFDFRWGSAPDPAGELTALFLTGLLLKGEREKFIDHKQINDVTIKIINSCGRLPARKFPSSWPPMQIQIILFYM